MVALIGVKMGLNEKQCFFLFKVANLISWCEAQGYVIVGGELDRKQEMQDIYIATGKSKKKYSNHQNKLAIDIFRIVDGRLATREEYRLMGECWESLSPRLRWGGRYGVNKRDYPIKVGWDPNHFEHK
jgi:hypothetical protein